MSVDSRLGPTDWISQFLAFTDEIPSPDIFRLWAGISCLSGVLERKVWAKTYGKQLFPHMFIVLVGPPGSGKTFVSDIVEDLWRTCAKVPIHIAPKSMSFASLGDVLKDSVRKVVRPASIPPYEEFNSLLIHARELKVLVPEYTTIMIDRLTDLWDCKVWDERLRGGGINYVIEKPQIHLLAGETPSYFNSMIPDNAWEGGFLSRTILVWAGETRIVDLFSDSSLTPAKTQTLSASLIKKANLYGQIQFSDEAAALIRDWHQSGMEPAPQNPKMVHYNSRRVTHLLKLIMTSCVSRTDSLKVEPIDFERARSWLLATEDQFDEIFKAAASVGDGKVINDCWYWLIAEYQRRKKPIPAAEVNRWISARVPAFHVDRVMKVMEDGEYIKRDLTSPIPAYIPLSKIGKF